MEHKPIKTDLDKNQLIGNVKFLSETTYNAVIKNGKILKGKKNGGSTHLLFDEKGFLIEAIYFNFDGSFKRKLTHKFEDKHNLYELNYFQSDGNPAYLGTYEYEFDERGNIIEDCFYNIEGNLNSKCSSKYDINDNKIEANYYDVNGLVFQYLYFYDEQGYKTEVKTFNPDGSLYYRGTYKYEFDIKGIKIAENSFNSYGKLISKDRYEYEFDKIGNWIKKIEYEHEKPKSIMEREIKYY